MKITIKDFGPIKNFNYDLSKDLIVTYGDNNIGKSYSMKIIYLLLKNFKNVVGTNGFGVGYYRYFGLTPYTNLSSQVVKKLVNDFISSKKQRENISEFIIAEFYSKFTDIFMPEFINSCNNTFGNLNKSIENNATIEVSFNRFQFIIDLKKKIITGKIDEFKPIYLKKTETDFHKSRRYKNYFDIYVFKNVDTPTEVIVEEINNNLFTFSNFISRRYDDIYFLPASRSGIYSGMSAFGSIVAELSKSKAYLTKKIELPGISEPISDYFIALSNLKFKENEDFRDFYSKIEQNILKGKVTIDKNKNTLVYIPENLEIPLDMTEVSSMVSEISPIVAFLKYIVGNPARKNKNSMQAKSILFIEEPEAHLHPHNQIALIEIFSCLSALGIKLIISSHSNYVFNKLNNLILSQKIDYKIYLPIILEIDDGGSKSRKLDIDELGVNDENFIDVSESLYKEREKIITEFNTEDLSYDK